MCEVGVKISVKVGFEAFFALLKVRKNQNAKCKMYFGDFKGLSRVVAYLVLGSFEMAIFLKNGLK